MTPQQTWIINQITPILVANNPGASADQILIYATTLSGFMLSIIIPNLQDINGNPITFVIPAGS